MDRKTLLNAVSLVFASMGLMGIIGASLAGVAIEWLGVEPVYFIIAALYAGAILALGQIPHAEVITRKQTSDSVFLDLREGINYLKGRPMIVSLLVLVVVRVILGGSYTALLHVYASDVLHFGAQGLGLLSAAPGFGTLAGSLSLASMGDFKGKGKVLLISGAVMGLSILGFANSRNFALAFACLFLVGAARRGVIITSQTLVQMNCEDAYRGRIMAMYLMSVGFMPLSTLPAGAISDVWGVPVALTLQGGWMTLIFVALWLSHSKVRRME